MRIDSIHIEGFGHFADRRFGPIDTPVTIFYGPNEAGKSTLLAYLRCILFGFPNTPWRSALPTIGRGLPRREHNGQRPEGDAF